MAGPEIMVVLPVFSEDGDLRKANNLIQGTAHQSVAGQGIGKAKALI